MEKHSRGVALSGHKPPAMTRGRAHEALAHNVGVHRLRGTVTWPAHHGRTNLRERFKSEGTGAMEAAST